MKIFLTLQDDKGKTCKLKMNVAVDEFESKSKILKNMLYLLENTIEHHYRLLDE